MIELLGFKKLGERIEEIQKTVGYVSYPCDCATEMGKFAQEQFQLDLKAIEKELESAAASEYWSDRIYDLISAIDSALEHKDESCPVWRDNEPKESVENKGEGSE